MTRQIFMFLLFLATSSVQAAELIAGPMPGHSAMRAVKVWLQTDAPAEVALEYWPSGDRQALRTTSARATRPEHAHTLTVQVADLEPGVEYQYRVILDGEPQSVAHPLRFKTQPLWQWREDAPDFSFALGSCAYINEAVYDRPGKPYGSGYQIFDAIADSKPDFMLWVGDNVYYREADWDSPASMYERFSHTRQLPELQRLLTSTHHYATWDDHDYGPDNADGAYPLKDQALEVFNNFWPNPDFSGTEPAGVSNYFEWHDAAFFLLDNRFFRSANHRTTGKHALLGERQINWLIDSLRSSSAAFKFVVIGGQVINGAEVHENYINLAPGERRYLLDRIDAEDIPGVVFLSGDRHHSVLMKKTSNVDYPLYDWTVSPLTAGAGSPGKGEDLYRVEGSVYTERNFGIAEITGPKGDRRLTLKLHDSDGEFVWSHKIHQRDLQ